MKNGLTTIRAYAADVLLLAFCIAVGLSFVGKPHMVTAVSVRDINVRGTSGPPKARESALSPGEKPGAKPVVSYKRLEERNIFSADGSYDAFHQLRQLPEISYTLIAVLKGKEKRAVFRDYTGSMVFLRKGDKLKDGAEIRDIDNVSVKTRKGKEIKEYRIFDVKPTKRAK